MCSLTFSFSCMVRRVCQEELMSSRSLLFFYVKFVIALRVLHHQRERQRAPKILFVYKRARVVLYLEKECTCRTCSYLSYFFVYGEDFFCK